MEEVTGSGVSCFDISCFDARRASGVTQASNVVKLAVCLRARLGD